MKHAKQPEAPTDLEISSEGAEESITIHVQPTTGGLFDVEISPKDSADELRRKISRIVQAPKERLKVLFKEQVLEAKPLKDYNIGDGSKVTLLPSVESGFSSTVQGTQQSIIQAIEGLSDPQIDDFLSGQLPLTLALRVGDHMMFVQLQLERPQAGHEPRWSRNHLSTSSLTELAQSASRALPARLFANMKTPLLPPTDPAKAAAKVDFKDSPPIRTATSPITGLDPKVSKLSADGDATDHGRSASAPPHFLSRETSSDGPPYSIFDPQQVSHHYKPIASHINHHPQGGANHLRRLVSACSSLEQAVTIPPTATLDGPTTDRLRKSPRKRPTDFSSESYHQRSAHPYFPTAFIQNALLRRHHLREFSSLPASSLISSAYARYQSSSRASQGSSATPHSAPASPTSPPSEIRRKHPLTTNMLQVGGQQHNDKSERHHHKHHKRASGRLASGSFSHHASGLSGARVVRQMQRLRRLCGSHQQCVAYSSPELASEISSIVHMAKHQSRSDGSSHRRGHKNCRECHSRDKLSRSASGASTSGVQATGACIDSFATHGPGIFSGTFSGSLHPSIQDANGKPKRDPKTILKILTDLLSATQLHQGQLGGTGRLPQLFKDHFKSERPVEKEEVSNSKTGAGDDNTKSSEELPQQKTEEIHSKQKIGSEPAQRNHPHSISASHSSLKVPFPAQYLSSVSTIPIGRIPVVYAGSRHPSSRGRRRNSPGNDGSCSKHHRRHHHCKLNAGEKCCSSVRCRRHAKQQMAATLTVKREYENVKTRNKMKELAKKMEQQRQRRQTRRNASKTCPKQNVDTTSLPEKLTRSGDSATESRIVHTGEITSGKMEVQFDGPVETVTV